MWFPGSARQTRRDGAIQGLFELSGVPYAGCDIQSSALCMDKSLRTRSSSQRGIATPNFRIIAAGEMLMPISLPIRLCETGRSGSSSRQQGVAEEDCERAGHRAEV